MGRVILKIIKTNLAIGVILTKATPLGVYIMTNQSARGVILKKPKSSVILDLFHSVLCDTDRIKTSGCVYYG